MERVGYGGGFSGARFLGGILSRPETRRRVLAPSGSAKLVCPAGYRICPEGDPLLEMTRP
ncbi:hypothetical protein HPA02_25170 [Bisbaumannia pacifica]|uniref:Uncharacterized protein n=1 Tax=Bisbaumannia pacifica TaxID=77098 RepID=A0A510XA01_9GAMM|nr:hypothetical protein HPA02_25170 [Halomonas pacifica]